MSSDLRRDTLTRLTGYGPLGRPTGVHIVPSIIDFSRMMYKVAVEGGYTENENDFIEDFAAALNAVHNGNFSIIVQYPTKTDFPSQGVSSGLYIDDSTGEVYYWSVSQNKYLSIEGGSGTGTINDVYIGTLPAVVTNGEAVFDVNGVLIELGIEAGAEVNKINSVALGTSSNLLPISGQKITIPIAGALLGVVKGSSDNDKISVAIDGTMLLNKVSTTKLYVPFGDELTIDSGNP